MDPVFFLHIPKTAGTSLRLWLKQAMPEAGSGDLFYPKEFAAVSDADLAKRVLVAGHFAWAEVERFARLAPRVRAITMLRDPRAVSLSMYKALDRTNEIEIERSLYRNNDPSAVKKYSASGDIRDFLLGPDGDGIMADYQLRRLLPDGDPGEGWTLSPTRCPRPDDVDVGLNQLMELNAFGIIEHYDRSCAILCDALKWPWLGNVEKHNVHNSAPEVETENDDLLTRDLAFYALAVDLFEQRWADLCARIGADPAAPDQGLADVIAGLDARALETLSTDRMGWTGVEDGLFARGLGERFFYGPEGRWLRNVTGKLTLFAPCPADARRLSLCFGYILPDPEKTVLTLNGMATPFVTRYEQEPGGTWRIWLDADLPGDRKNAVAATVSGATDVQMQGSFLGFAIA